MEHSQSSTLPMDILFAKLPWPSIMIPNYFLSSLLWKFIWTYTYFQPFKDTNTCTLKLVKFGWNWRNGSRESFKLTKFKYRLQIHSAITGISKKWSENKGYNKCTWKQNLWIIRDLHAWTLSLEWTHFLAINLNIRFWYLYFFKISPLGRSWPFIWIAFKKVMNVIFSTSLLLFFLGEEICKAIFLNNLEPLRPKVSCADFGCELE